MFLSFGVTKSEFLDSTPRDMECYIEAEKMRIRRRDTENWQMGMYNLSAFGTALSKALNGRKSHAEYRKTPIYEEIEELQKPEEELTEEEKERGRKNLLMSLQIMQTNFEMNHSGGDE